MHESKRKPAHLIFLALATVAFAAMLLLVATGVTRRRNARDLTYGLEELDLLLETAAAEWTPETGATLDEAAAMVPWLADRARSAGEALRVLKRAHTLYDLHGRTEPLAQAAQTLLEEFPANTTLRSVAVFAAVRAGRPHEALEAAREGLGDEGGALYAWSLLNAPGSTASSTEHRDSTAAPTETPPVDPPELLLADLSADSASEDFERAWSFSGDLRYALDAAVLRIGNGDQDGALDLALAAGLEYRWPLFVAGLLIDRSRFDEAVVLLSGAPRSSVDAQLLLADAHLFAGDTALARAVYERLLLLEEPPVHASLNLAWLETDARRASALVTRAAETHPESWDAARARATLAGPAGIELLERWENTERVGEARLLRLRLEADPQRRGYAAALWQLLAEHPSEPGFRYATWYFAARGDLTDARIVLDRFERADKSSGSSWALFYDGLLAAHSGDWGEAARRFEESFVASPSWQAALNAGVALFRTGAHGRGSARMQDALLLARYGAPRQRDDDRIAVFLTAARASQDASDVRALVSEALEIDPASPEALLLGAQLENDQGR